MDLPPRVENGEAALLVETTTRHRYRSIPLLKLSTFLKEQGSAISYAVGKDEAAPRCERILLTTLFTFDWLESVEAIRYYQRRFPDAHFSVGGVYASLMPEHVAKHTGIRPVVGIVREVDECPPDYLLFPLSAYGSTSHVFTTRGCPWRCQFCGTKAIEPEMRIIENWRGHFLPGGKRAVIHDNNILAHGDDHFSDVIEHMKAARIRFFFDNGLDCRLFESHHARELRRSSISSIRFAFDEMDRDGYVQDAIGQCVRNAIPPSKITVFVLYNFRDEIEDALYRLDEVLKMGARPYAMRYTPLKWLNPSRTHVGEHWTLEDVRAFGEFVNSGIMRRMTYEEWLQKRKKMAIGREGGGTRRMNTMRRLLEFNLASDDEESVLGSPDFIERYLDFDLEDSDPQSGNAAPSSKRL